MLLEPLPGVHHLMTQYDISLFLVLLVELQIEIQYNAIISFKIEAPYSPLYSNAPPLLRGNFIES